MLSKLPPGSPCPLPSKRCPFSPGVGQNVERMIHNISNFNLHIISPQGKGIFLGPMSLLSTYYVPSTSLNAENMIADDAVFVLLCIILANICVFLCFRH